MDINKEYRVKGESNMDDALLFSEEVNFRNVKDRNKQILGFNLKIDAGDVASVIIKSRNKKRESYQQRLFY